MEAATGFHAEDLPYSEYPSIFKVTNAEGEMHGSVDFQF